MMTEPQHVDPQPAGEAAAAAAGHAPGAADAAAQGADAAAHGADAAAHAAGAHGAHDGPFDAGSFILHHIADGPTLDLPLVGTIHLPTLHLGPVVLPITRHVVMMWLVSGLLLLVLWLAARPRRQAPRGLQNLVEMIIVFVRDELARKNIGKHGDRYVPYLLTTFVFILLCNLIGLVPWMSTATGNIAVTAGLAGLSFLVTQFAGMREFGVAGHFRNLVPHGLPAWLLPIMIPVEILGLFTKPFALCVRLFANMTAGHVVILSLISLVFILKSAWVGVGLSVPFALFINGIELLVAFLQAYIFTMLTSLFIGMSAHPQH